MDKNKLAISTYRKMAQKYTDAYFDDISDFPQVLKYLNLIPKGGQILDVGSGPGNFTKFIKNQNYTVTGVDLTPEMIDIAKQKVPGTDFLLMDMRDLNFSDNKFDGLIAAYSLIHIPTVELLDTLKGFYRVLKPGAHALIITQKGEPDQTIDEPLAPGCQMFFNFFTEERLATVLTEAGFTLFSQQVIKTNDQLTMSSSVIYTTVRKLLE